MLHTSGNPTAAHLFPMCKNAFTRFQYKPPRSYTSSQAPPLPEIPLRGTLFAHEQECSLSLPQKSSTRCASLQAPRTSQEPLRRIFSDVQKRFYPVQYKSPRSYTSSQAPPLPEISLRGTLFAHEQECSLSLPQKSSTRCASPQAPHASREPLRRIFSHVKSAVCRFQYEFPPVCHASRASFHMLLCPQMGSERPVARLGNAFPIFAAL